MVCYSDATRLKHHHWECYQIFTLGENKCHDIAINANCVICGIVGLNIYIAECGYYCFVCNITVISADACSTNPNLIGKVGDIIGDNTLSITYMRNIGCSIKIAPSVGHCWSGRSGVTTSGCKCYRWIGGKRVTRAKPKGHRWSGLKRYVG